MQVFDLKKIAASLEGAPKAGKNTLVLYETKEFKLRVVSLPAGGEIPTCEMSSYVVFYVVSGSAEATINQERRQIKEGECLITAPPATLSLKTKGGVKIIGFQIMPTHQV